MLRLGKFAKKFKPVLDFFNLMDQRNVMMSSAGIAYFTLLAVFPAATAGVAMSLFIITPEQFESIKFSLAGYMPSEMAEILSASLSSQSARTNSNLWFALIGIVLAILGASGAMQNTMRALNTIHQVSEKRSLAKIYWLGFVLTLGVIALVGSVGLLLLLSFERLTNWGVDTWIAFILVGLRWLVIICLIHVMIGMLFKYGPSRSRAGRTHVTRGTVIATGLWLGITAAFFAYVQYLPFFAHSYSVFAGIIALMIWFQLGSMAILVGALLDKSSAQ